MDNNSTFNTSKISISQNTKCDNSVGFPKSSHILAFIQKNMARYKMLFRNGSTTGKNISKQLM